MRIPKQFGGLTGSPTQMVDGRGQRAEQGGVGEMGKGIAKGQQLICYLLILVL